MQQGPSQSGDRQCSSERTHTKKSDTCPFFPSSFFSPGLRLLIVVGRKALIVHTISAQSWKSSLEPVSHKAKEEDVSLFFRSTILCRDKKKRKMSRTTAAAQLYLLLCVQEEKEKKWCLFFLSFPIGTPLFFFTCARIEPLGKKEGRRWHFYDLMYSAILWIIKREKIWKFIIAIWIELGK